MNNFQQYRQWEQDLASGRTNMGFNGWMLANAIHNLEVEDCPHPFDQVKVERNHPLAPTIIRCGLCGVARQP